MLIKVPAAKRLVEVPMTSAEGGLKRHTLKRDTKPFAARFAGLLLAATVIGLSIIPGVASAASGGEFLVAQRAIKAPAGFNGLCERYAWVCKNSDVARVGNKEKLDLASQINTAVNRQVRQIEDQRQYGRAEHWALPTQKGGDCEDLVLLKKKMLIERGVPSNALLISTVLDKKLNSHAVLVLRTAGGDLVLDNLTNRILPWHQTGYTFLKLQNPKSLARWDAVLAGGVIDDRPTASR